MENVVTALLIIALGQLALLTILLMRLDKVLHGVAAIMHTLVCVALRLGAKEEDEVLEGDAE